MVAWGGFTKSWEKKWKEKEKGEEKSDNAEFQRTARRDRKAFFNEQCKEIEGNSRMGKTRDLKKDWWDQGSISCRDEHNKGQKL